MKGGCLSWWMRDGERRERKKEGRRDREREGERPWWMRVAKGVVWQRGLSGCVSRLAPSR